MRECNSFNVKVIKIRKLLTSYQKRIIIENQRVFKIEVLRLKRK